MIFAFKLFVVIVAGLLPPFIGWLFFIMSPRSSEAHPAYKCFWAVLSGIAVTYTGNFLYAYSPDRDTGTVIANAFTKALPDIITVSALLVVLAAIAVVLYWGIARVQKERERLLDDARREAALVRGGASSEAEKMKAEAAQAATKTREDANREAAEIIGNAAAAKREADTEKQQLVVLRQELEAEYQEKHAELERKRKSWLDELAGVKADRDRCKERLASILKGSIEHWEKEGSEGAAKRRKKKLAKLEIEDTDETQR